MTALTRTVAGLLIALAIAAGARAARSLSTSGAIAAVVVGTLAIGAGWRWGVLLVAFFVSSTALSRWRAAAKEARTAGIVAKGGERDAIQVLANGGALALAAAVALVRPELAPLAAAAGAGSLAAAASDTWATEVGTAIGGTPRSVTTLRAVAPGVSGGITLAGTVAALAGALFIAALAWVLGWPAALALAALAGGIAGSTLDSLLGATLQSRRWCDRCARGTERDTHDCGAPTRRVGGLAWLGNDAVNVACTVAGGLLALSLAR